MNKELRLAALNNRYSVILARGKTADGRGVLRKIRREINRLSK